MSKTKRRKKRRLRRWVRLTLLLTVPAFFLLAFLIILPTLRDSSQVSYKTMLRVPSDPDQPPLSYDRKNRTFIQSDEVLKDCLLAVSENGLDFYLIRLDRDGHMMRGWYEKDGKQYYYQLENGAQCSGACLVNDHELMFEKTGELADGVFVRSGRDYCWYEKGLKRAADDDQILFVENEPGFYYLQSDQGGARASDCEIVLADGRIARFAEDGRLLAEDDAASLQFALPEASLTSTATKMVPAAEYIVAQREEPIRYISHRGYHISAPENSLAAYQESWRQGYRYVECDIQMTSDMVPVLLHNPTINSVARYSDGSAIGNTVYVGDYTYDELLEYDFGIASGSEYAGMKITRLDTFLAWCSASSLHPYIELKMETVDSQEDVDIIVEEVRKQNMEHRVSWISFSPAALSYVLHDLPDAEVGYLLSSEDTLSYMPEVVSLRQQGYSVFVDAAHTLCADVSGQCQEYSIPLGLWMVNWPDYLAGMDPYVTAITTDNLLPPYE